jgi:AraC family transcriptional regulator, alkane utilization regulator
MIHWPAKLIDTPDLLELCVHPLSDVLHVTPLTRGVFVRAELSEPWCFSGNDLPSAFSQPRCNLACTAFCHYVVEGALSVSVSGAPPLRANAGEAIVVPRNEPHRLGSDLDQHPAPVAALLPHGPRADGARIRFGGGGTPARLICGFFGYEAGARNQLFASLPPALLLRFDESHAAEWIRTTFEYAAQQTVSGAPDAEVIIAKLSELLLLEAVRRSPSASREERRSTLPVVRDAYVSRAVTRLHARFDARWTVQALAREVGLSRSALTDRFTNALGEPPMHFLARCRMRTAARLLGASELPMARIAEQIGYDSEAAFARAFKRWTGSPPAAWRRSIRQEQDAGAEKESLPSRFGRGDPR